MRRALTALLAVLMLAPNFSGAQSIADLQARVDALLRQLQGLQGSLDAAENAMRPAPRSVAAPAIIERHRVCRAYRRVMQRGISGDDVRALQEFLITEGMFAETPTGYYGPITVEAVKAWQAREGIASSGSEATTGWGVFGPKSREHLRHWCGGQGATAATSMRANPVFGIAPLTVSVSTNISGFRSGVESYVIDFGDGTIAHAAACTAPFDTCVAPGVNTHTYLRGGSYTIRLIRTTSPCPTDLACGIPGVAVPLSSLTVRVTETQSCTDELRPVCGLQRVTCVTAPCPPVQASFSNRCMMDVAGATYVHEGMCANAGTTTIPIISLGKPALRLSSMPAYVQAGAVSVSWTTDANAQQYGMYLILEDTANRPLLSQKVDPLKGTATMDVSTGAYCNQFFSGATGLCYIPSGRNYRIRAALYAPTGACVGTSCAQGTAQIATFALSNPFKLLGGDQISEPLPVSCTSVTMQCPDGSTTRPTGPQCELLCPQ